MNDDDFLRWRLIVIEADFPAVVAHRDDKISGLQDIFFDFIDPAALAWPRAVVGEGMGVKYEGLASLFTDFQPRKRGHPVMGVDDVEVMMAGRLRDFLSESDDLGAKIRAIEVSGIDAESFGIEIGAQIGRNVFDNGESLHFSRVFTAMIGLIETDESEVLIEGS